LSHWAGADTRFTPFRGDGWQILLAAPELSLDAVIMLTAHLRALAPGVATRLALGFGDIDRLPPGDLSRATGAAFVLAGDALDTMPRHRRIALAGGPALLDRHEAVFHLVHFIATRWSAEQAQAIILALAPDHGPTQEDIAQPLGISRQAVQLRLKGAGWDALAPALDQVRRGDWDRPTP
jgi:hypothetical protein